MLSLSFSKNKIKEERKELSMEVIKACYIICKTIFLMFIYFERETERAGKGQRVREREGSTLIPESNVGLDLMIVRS